MDCKGQKLEIQYMYIWTEQKINIGLNINKVLDLNNTELIVLRFTSRRWDKHPFENPFLKRK